MLFTDFFITENYSQMVQIHAGCDIRMGTYPVPGLVHARRPVDVIKNKYRLAVGIFQASLKIFPRGFFGVIPIKKNQTRNLKFF